MDNEGVIKKSDVKKVSKKPVQHNLKNLAGFLDVLIQIDMKKQKSLSEGK